MNCKQKENNSNSNNKRETITGSSLDLFRYLLGSNKMRRQ